MSADRLTWCLLAQYLVLALWHAVDGTWWKSLYWLGAAMLTTALLGMQ